MHEALRLHDKTMRQCIATHGGYEIMTQGDAFHVAFHDCVEALGIALDVHTALYDADWSDSILALPEACGDEVKRLRGLRVRIAIHHGSVEHRKNDVTGHREYTGQTVNFAKSVEHMSHWDRFWPRQMCGARKPSGVHRAGVSAGFGSR